MVFIVLHNEVVTMKRLYLIVGRSGAGKDTYAHFLEEQGLKGVKSYATRPKRSYDEDTHIFITQEEADKITDKVAVTNINGYEYFATKKQVDEADYYIIDPKGIMELTHNYKDLKYKIIYLYCDKEVRKERAISRGDAEKEIEIFTKRCNSENAQFNEFEKWIFTFDNVIIHNTSKITMNELKELVHEDVF